MYGGCLLCLLYSLWLDVSLSLKMVALIVLGQISSRLSLRRTPLGPVSVLEGCPSNRKSTKGLFTWRWGTPGRWGSPLRGSLRASSTGLSGGGAGKGIRTYTTTSLEFEFHLQFPCGSPSTELSDFRQSARSGPLVAKSANFKSQNRVLLAKVVFSPDFWLTSWFLLKQLFLSPSWPLSQ